MSLPSIDRIRLPRAPVRQYAESRLCLYPAQNVVSLSRECEFQRNELRKFQGASYVMQQRIIRESQRLKDMTRHKGELAQTFEMEIERKLNEIMKQQLGMPIDQPLPRPTPTPLPDNDGIGEEDEDLVGELYQGSMTPKPFRRRASGDILGESRSLPAYSPRQSPYPTPCATPFSSRSHSPTNVSPSR